MEKSLKDLQIIDVVRGLQKMEYEKCSNDEEMPLYLDYRFHTKEL